MRRSTVLLASALVIAACSTDDGEQTDDVALDAPEIDADDPDTDDPDADSDTSDPDTGDEEDGGEGPEDEAVSQGDAVVDEDGASPELVDLTEATPGTWPVGDAGTVTFSLVDGALVLDDVTANDGWSSQVDEEDADEIEVEFRRDGVDWEFEVELEDGGSTLEVEIRQDIHDADPGSYDIGDAGTFAFDVEGDRLVLTDLHVADGWTVTEQDEDDDEIEIDLAEGARRFDVEVELDDGRVEIEIDFTIAGPVEG